ncbi:predicted protein [Aspergillus terreus NIH2624]|uniref:C2 NT-type domain-containing protein n=1 Tax=Aspergillus terreus (strain NIH 2624 / FGSC A1156) TaxID=341663 RepID=Q0CTC5_ASPTN|nr:uncharacterized protein ATEG_03059 [Aspergillus terreus NIH2624]EAU36333.1 predicted protein [Aspergillus terreus NIH2624]
MARHRNQSLHECEIHFEVIQEFESPSHGDNKNLLGRIKLNLCEYVDKSDDEEGIVRRYLMQDSKINSTLRIGIAIRQVEGDRNFTTPPLKSAMVFGGIAGVVSSEQGDPVDLGRLPSLSSQSTEVSDLQDMYRRTLAASWNSNSDDLPADKLIEELFSGRVSWHNDVQDSKTTKAADQGLSPHSAGGAKPNVSSHRLSPGFERRGKSSSSNQFPNDGRLPGFPAGAGHSRKNASMDNQFYDNTKPGVWKSRNTDYELSEFDIREDLRSWEIGTQGNEIIGHFIRLDVLSSLLHMLVRSSTSTVGLLSSQVPRDCTRCRFPFPLHQRRVFVRFQSTDSDTQNTESEPRFKRKPKRRPRFKKEEAKRVPIGVTALGKPGEVVVVSNPRRRRPLPQNTQEKSTDSIDKNALPFMLNELEDNEDILDPSTVNERIESFCAPYLPRAKLTLTDWDGLRTRLQLSFTTRQLSDYVSQFARDAPMSPESRIKHGKVDTTEWKPGTSAFFETGPGSAGGVADRVATSQSLSGKQLISERILRDCWHLGIIDEIGQLDVRLPSQSLTLLLNSKHFSFEELASLHDAKIDVTNSLGLVRITGRQNSCESIRDIVYDAITRIREEELALFSDVALSKDYDRVFSADFLSWISKTYGVAFEQDSGCPSKIFYLVENKQDADNARRTLNLAVYETSALPVPFGTYLPSSEPVSVYNVDLEGNLSWFNRQSSWFRWAFPSAQTAEMTTLDTPLFDKHQTRLSDELLKLLRQSSKTNDGSVEVHESLTATVGRCLFLRKPSFQEAELTAPQLGKLSLPRAFATEIPRVTSFLRMLTPHLPEEPQRPHRIRLVPSAIHARVFPQLELEVTVQGTRDSLDSGNGLIMRNVKAVLSENNVDYLLPESGLDLRFARQLTRDLSEDPALNEVHDTLSGLFSKSLSNDIEVPLPTFAQITLPNDVLRQPANAAGPTGYSSGEYMFLPVNDIRGTRIHRYDFKGQQLNYAFYESGPFNAPRSTDLFLSMDLTGEGDAGEVPAQREFGSFYNAACSLAFELDKVWRMM